MATKRRRSTAVARVSKARPIDKLLVSINKDGVGAAQVATTLYTATFPATLTGLRWDLSIWQNAGTGAAIAWWAIVVVRDGLTADTIAVSDAAAFYNPEQDVLAFGTAIIDNNVEGLHEVGSTKTMRKLKGGDELQFLAYGTATDTASIRGVVQFFAKS